LPTLLEHLVQSHQVLHPAVVVVGEMKLSDIIVLQLTLEGLQGLLVQAGDCDLGTGNDLLA